MTASVGRRISVNTYRKLQKPMKGPVFWAFYSLCTFVCYVLYRRLPFINQVIYFHRIRIGSPLQKTWMNKYLFFILAKWSPPFPSWEIKVSCKLQVTVRTQFLKVGQMMKQAQSWIISWDQYYICCQGTFVVDFSYFRVGVKLLLNKEWMDNGRCIFF